MQPSQGVNAAGRTRALSLVIMAAAAAAFLGLMLLVRWPPRMVATLAGELAVVISALAGTRALLWFWSRERRLGWRLIAALAMAWLVMSLVGGAALCADSTATDVLHANWRMTGQDIALYPAWVLLAAVYGGYYLFPIWAVMGLLSFRLLYWARGERLRRRPSSPPLPPYEAA
jgi:hypothetical protein